ncbi:MAG: ATP-binding cassette domain-containing protein [Bifidobacteriaceae bacterium]|nr:ATP-binding cassette domain-containing protein [Bifidobacteriaceae bacterium]
MGEKSTGEVWSGRDAKTGAPVAVRGAGVAIAGTVLLPPVSLDLEAGRILALTGPNGVGKTTLLRVLAGQQLPTVGAATVFGFRPDQRRPEFRRHVAHMLSPRPFAPTLTIGEQLTLTALTWGFSAADADRLGRRLLRRFDLVALRDRFTYQLSAGQSQAASLCVTLARPFGLLLLDEPDQALDDDRLGALEAELRALADAGTTVVLATHSRALRTSLGDKVIDLESLRDAVV